MSLEPGEEIDGKYRIIKMIGEGGMGAVYSGENIAIARRVAIKVLHAHAAADATTVQRFEREAQAAGRIGSDHILEILDLGALENGDRYMVMEFLDGEPLADRIQRLGRLTPAQCVVIFRQILKGLSAAHQAGIIHRDLKPDNVFVLKEKAGVPDFVKLIDFGISKFKSMGGDHAMTRTGTVMGTPYYMSPEQAKGSSEADHRTDLYAVGVMLYEALSGGVPFDADNFNTLMFKIALEAPPPIQERVPDIDPEFAQIVAYSMNREVGDRFQSAEEFSASLAHWASVRDLSQSAPAVVPPAMQSHADIQVAPAAERPHGNTAQAWSQTGGGEVSIPKKSNAGLFIGLGLAGFLLVGGVAAALAIGLGGGDDDAAPVAAIESGEEPVAATEPSAEATEPETDPTTEPDAAATEADGEDAGAADPPVAAANPATPPKTGGTKPSTKPAGGGKPPKVGKPATPPTKKPPKGGGDFDFGY